MTNYINQLLEDLKKAEQNLPTPLNYKALFPNHPAFDYGLDYVVAWECTPDQSMHSLYGIAPEAFPPPERLTDEQIEALNKGIQSLWLAFGTDVIIPENATERQCYKVFTQAWREESVQYFPPDMGGHCSFDFCNGDTERCKWGEACSCLKHVEEWERFNEEFDKNYKAGKYDTVEIPITPLRKEDFESRDWGDDLPF